MNKAVDIGNYFINIDKDKKLFDLENKQYDSNIKLNYMLYLAQAIYIAKYGEELFDDKISIEKDKINIIDIRKIGNKSDNKSDNKLDKNIKDFLNTIYEIYNDMTKAEFIEIIQYDDAFEQAIVDKKNIITDMIKYEYQYKILYCGALYLIEQLNKK